MLSLHFGRCHSLYFGRCAISAFENDSFFVAMADRFFDQEVVGFQNGGALHWRNGDVPDKPVGCPPGTTGCSAKFVFPTAVRSYVSLPPPTLTRTRTRTRTHWHTHLHSLSSRR